MKKCLFAIKNTLVCDRPMPKCPFSHDCRGEVTEQEVGILRQKAEVAFIELKKAREKFKKAVKEFAALEQRLTNKEYPHHLVDAPNIGPWKIWGVP
jgi:GMP synthase PP-ATPase subunit